MKKRKSTIKDLLLILYDSILFYLVVPNIIELSDDFNLQKFTLIISVL